MKSRRSQPMPEQLPCDLEVQVNTDHTFFLNKGVLLASCGGLAKQVQKVMISSPLAVNTGGRRAPRYELLLHDVPGGPDAFEMVVRFCYTSTNSSSIFPITIANVAMLRCVAEYLGMATLLDQTERFLSGMGLWSWDEALSVLKSCEALFPAAEKSGLVQRCVDALAFRASLWKLNLIPSCSPLMPSSPRSLLETDSSSSVASSNGRLPANPSWVSADMSSLSVYLMEKLIKAMAARCVDGRLLAKLLLRYLKAAMPVLPQNPRSDCSPNGKLLHAYLRKVQQEVLETVVSLIYPLARESVSCRSLFGIQRVALLLNVSKRCRKQLEEMIGSQLDKATLDNILIPCTPQGGGGGGGSSSRNCYYDVDLVLRLVIMFLDNTCPPTPLFSSASRRSFVSIHDNSSASSSATATESSLKAVGSLIDRYLAEIAPDPQLRASKFGILASALPDLARDSHDDLYRAFDIYVEAHPSLTEHEVMELSKVLRWSRLSMEACKHVAQNKRLPSRLSLQVLLLQQERLKATIDCNLASVPGLGCSGHHQYSHRNGGFPLPITAISPSSPTSRGSDLSICRSDGSVIAFSDARLRMPLLGKMCKSMRSQIGKCLFRFKITS